MHMDTRIKFLYLSEPDMIKAGVKNMDQCVEAMEDLLVTLNKGDYVMAGVNHNSHGAQVIFPDDPQFEGMPKNADDRRFMAMPAYLGGKYQMAGMNQQLNSSIETVFLMADVSLQPIASKLVKEIAMFGGEIHRFVSPAVRDDVMARIAKTGTLGDY